MSAQDSAAAERRLAQASSFGPAAVGYDRVRPRYPDGAIQWLLAPLGPGRARVLDIGAGTGIMARQIQALGHQVTAVEPDELMRAQLSATAPGVTVCAGTAESLPLAAASADAAVAAQAYHWFDHERAHAEFGRVIRPGGVFAAIWNCRDETTDWVAEYSRIVDGHGVRDGVWSRLDQTAVPTFGDCFEPVKYERFSHSARHSPDDLVELSKSRSYFLTATPGQQAALESDVRALAATHPDLAGRDEFTLPYVTVVFRATRR